MKLKQSAIVLSTLGFLAVAGQNGYETKQKELLDQTTAHKRIPLDPNLRRMLEENFHIDSVNRLPASEDELKEIDLSTLPKKIGDESEAGDDLSNVELGEPPKQLIPQDNDMSDDLASEGKDGEAAEGEKGIVAEGKDGEATEGEEGIVAEGKDGEATEGEEGIVAEGKDGEATEGEEGIVAEGKDGEATEGEEGIVAEGKDGEATEGEEGIVAEGKDGEATEGEEGIVAEGNNGEAAEGDEGSEIILSGDSNDRALEEEGEAKEEVEEVKLSEVEELTARLAQLEAEIEEKNKVINQVCSQTKEKEESQELVNIDDLFSDIEGLFGSYILPQREPSMDPMTMMMFSMLMGQNNQSGGLYANSFPAINPTQFMMDQINQGKQEDRYYDMMSGMFDIRLENTKYYYGLENQMGLLSNRIDGFQDYDYRRPSSRASMFDDMFAGDRAPSSYTIFPNIGTHGFNLAR